MTKDEQRAYNHRYYMAHRETILKLKREFEREHPEECRAYRRVERQGERARETHNRSCRNWYARHRAEICARRRARWAETREENNAKRRERRKAKTRLAFLDWLRRGKELQ